MAFGCVGLWIIGSARALSPKPAAVGDGRSRGQMKMAHEDKASLGVMPLQSERGERQAYPHHGTRRRG